MLVVLTGLVGCDIISVMRQIQSAYRRIQIEQLSQVYFRSLAAITEQRSCICKKYLLNDAHKRLQKG